MRVSKKKLKEELKRVKERANILKRLKSEKVTRKSQ